MAVFDMAKYFTPHEGQKEPFYSDVDTIALKWARRGGKGRLACFKLLDEYYRLAETRTDRSLVPNFHAGIVVPTYKTGNQAWMEVLAFIPKEAVAQVQTDEKMIWLKPHGNCETALIEMRSADNEDSLQGWGLDFCWVTESQEITGAAYNKLVPALRSPGRAHKLLAEGIPPEMLDHWFNALFIRGEDPDIGNSFASRLTYLDNPMLTEEDHQEIEGLKDSMTIMEWERMWLAKDPDEGEAPMPIHNVLERAVDWNEQEPIPGHSHVIGLDLGKQISATVLTVWDESTIPMRLRYFRRMLRQDWNVVKAMVIAANETWNPRVIHQDGQGPGDPLFDDFRFAGLPVNAVPIQGDSRENMLTKLAVTMERKKISLPREDQIVREASAMRRVKTGAAGSGRPRWTVRTGYMDDTVFSMALGITDLTLRDGPVQPRKAAESYSWSIA